MSSVISVSRGIVVFLILHIDHVQSAGYVNDLDSLVDEALAEPEPLLTPSAILHPSSHSRLSAYTDRDPLSVGQLANPQPLTSIRVWGIFMERRYVDAECMTVIL